MTPAAYPRVVLCDGLPACGRLRHLKGSARFAAVDRFRGLPRKRAQRAGPALPSYLALHHAGFSAPPVSPPERWALTPPFHPCPTERALRRRPAGFPARCHRAGLRRRSILCGTFRSQPHCGGFNPPPRAGARNSASRQTLRAGPLTLSGASPFSSPALSSLRRWCPDFPPARPL